MVEAWGWQDVNFHECVRWAEGCQVPHFTFFAPDGEFTLLTYRISQRFRPPITLQPFLEPQVRLIRARSNPKP